MDQLRAFIAIEIPSGIKKTMALQTAGLRELAGRSVRWVAPENIHLTLKFLGEMAPSNVGAVSQAIQLECNQQAPIEIAVNGWGCFPSAQRPRVVWVGLQAPAGLSHLQHQIDLATGRLGYPAEEKPFAAHLTIGRVREGLASAEMKTLQAVLSGFQCGEFGKFAATEVTLFKSELQPGGPIYTQLYKARFGTITPGNPGK